MPRRVQEGVCEVDFVASGNVEEAKAVLSSSKTLERAAEAFRVFGHPSRLRVLEALEGRELCVCDLSEVVGLSMSGTSQQLRELRKLGAIEYRVAGKFAYYTLSDRFWLEIARSVVERFTDSERATDSVNGKVESPAL